MRIADAGPVQCGDDPVEIRHVRDGPDTNTIHAPARDHIIAHEDLPITAIAKFLSQLLRV